MRKWLKQQREEKGLSARKVAELLGISESYYSLIEKGERQKTLDFSLVVMLSRILDVSMATIAEYEKGGTSQ